MAVLDAQLAMLEHATAPELRGRVSEVRGLALRVADLPVPVGAMVRIEPATPNARAVEGEVVSVDREHTLVMPLGGTTGIGAGDTVVAQQHAPYIHAGPALLGRVLDGMGRAKDGKGPIVDTTPQPLVPQPVDPLKRPGIREPLATGVRAIDGCVSMGKGQRLGVFAAPGVGKSTLLGQIARHTSADVNVIALVGERGREVRDFLDNVLGEKGLERSVIVCATSDEPALLRLRAAMVAAAVAEHFRDRGNDVLFLMDSVTRFCQAQRQIGLAAGEPPATRGYPPSVFAMLPNLLERAGRTEAGSITGLFAVLVEGDDMDEPIADACRGVLDGHVLLSRDLARKGHYPAIDVLGSISRVMPDVTDKQHQAAQRELLRLVQAYSEVEELLNIGAYTPGSNPEFDLAIQAKETIDHLLQQGQGEVTGPADFDRTRAQLLAVHQQIQQLRQQVEKSQKQAGRRGR